MAIEHASFGDAEALLLSYMMKPYELVLGDMFGRVFIYFHSTRFLEHAVGCTSAISA